MMIMGYAFAWYFLAALASLTTEPEGSDAGSQALYFCQTYGLAGLTLAAMVLLR